MIVVAIIGIWRPSPSRSTPTCRRARGLPRPGRFPRARVAISIYSAHMGNVPTGLGDLSVVATNAQGQIAGPFMASNVVQPTGWQAYQYASGTGGTFTISASGRGGRRHLRPPAVTVPRLHRAGKDHPSRARIRVDTLSTLSRTERNVMPAIKTAELTVGPSTLPIERTAGVLSSSARLLRVWMIPLALPVVTFLVFLPTLWNGFVAWDDQVNLYENPAYRGLTWPHIRWMFSNVTMGTGSRSPGSRSVSTTSCGR